MKFLQKEQKPENYFHTGFRINAWASTSLPPILTEFRKLVSALHDRSGTGSRTISAYPENGNNFQGVLKTLTHLKLPERMVLDCFQEGGQTGSHPRFYVRRDKAERHSDNLDGNLPDSLLPGEYEFNDLVIPDGSPESYWETMLLSRLDCMFNLVWHDRYREISLIDDRRLAEQELQLHGMEAEVPLADWDFSSHVLVGEKNVIITHTVFSAWRGLSQHRMLIRRRPNITIKSSIEIKRIEYNCGIRF